MRFIVKLFTFLILILLPTSFIALLVFVSLKSLTFGPISLRPTFYTIILSIMRITESISMTVFVLRLLMLGFILIDLFLSSSNKFLFLFVGQGVPFDLQVSLSFKLDLFLNFIFLCIRKFSPICRPESLLTVSPCFISFPFSRKTLLLVVSVRLPNVSPWLFLNIYFTSSRRMLTMTLTLTLAMTLTMTLAFVCLLQLTSQLLPVIDICSWNLTVFRCRTLSNNESWFSSLAVQSRRDIIATTNNGCWSIPDSLDIAIKVFSRTYWATVLRVAWCITIVTQLGNFDAWIVYVLFLVLAMGLIVTVKPSIGSLNLIILASLLYCFKCSRFAVASSIASKGQGKQCRKSYKLHLLSNQIMKRRWKWKFISRKQNLSIFQFYSLLSFSLLHWIESNILCFCQNQKGISASIILFDCFFMFCLDLFFANALFDCLQEFVYPKIQLVLTSCINHIENVLGQSQFYYSYLTNIDLLIQSNVNLPQKNPQIIEQRFCKLPPIGQTLFRLQTQGYGFMLEI